MSFSNVADFAHEADRMTPLQHGVLRYEALTGSVANTSTSSMLPAKLDRPFVFVPVGYIQRHSDMADALTASSCKPFLANILSAIGLPTLPNMAITTPETRVPSDANSGSGSSSASLASQSQSQQLPKNIQVVMRTKVHQLLETIVVDSAKSVNAWVIPESPRRWNPTAREILSICPSSQTSTPLASTPASNGSTSNPSNQPAVVALGLLTLMTGNTSNTPSTTTQADNTIVIDEPTVDNNGITTGTQLQQRIQQVMVPVGSPVQQVCRLAEKADEEEEDEDEDVAVDSSGSVAVTTTITDDAPCSQLTHILFFANRQDQMLFRQALLDAIPDYVIAFGDNLTPRGRDTVLRTIRNGSPLLLLKNPSMPTTKRKPSLFAATDDRINQLAQMIRHVKKHLTANTNASHMRTMVPLTTAVQQASKGERINKGDYQVLDSFLETFPLDFAPESVIVVDPLKPTSTPGHVQELLIQALARCFGLKQAKNPDIQILQQQALDYAWSFHKTMSKYAGKKKNSSENLHSQLVTCTFSSIISSVVYNQFFGANNKDAGDDASSSSQTAGYMATILLPLYVTSVKQESDKGTSLQQRDAFIIALAKLESEIFQFRCQVGKYRREDKRDATIQFCIQVFTHKIQAIWKSVQVYLDDDGMDMIQADDGNKDSKAQDETSADVPIVSLDSSRAIPATSGSSVIGSLFKIFQQNESKVMDFATKAKAGGIDLDKMKSSASSSIMHSLDEKKRGIQEDIENVAESTPLLRMVTNKAEEEIKLDHTFDIAGLDQKKSADHSKDDDSEEDSDDDDDFLPHGTFIDDNYSPLKVNNYLNARVKKVLAAKTSDIQSMSRRNKFIASCIKFITMLSGAAAALSLQWFVPIILGLTAALTTAQDFRKYPQRIQAGNELIVELHKQTLIWMGLSEFEKQLPHNKDLMVLAAEAAILAELEATHGGAGKAKSE